MVPYVKSSRFTYLLYYLLYYIHVNNFYLLYKYENALWMGDS